MFIYSKKALISHYEVIPSLSHCILLFNFVCVCFFQCRQTCRRNYTAILYLSNLELLLFFYLYPNESKHEIRFAKTVFLKVCFSHDWFRFVRRKNNRKFKVASHLFDKCTRALDSIYNSEEMTPPKQGNNRGENPQKLSIVSRSQNQ